MVGRERELTALRMHIYARRPVFLSGPAGMGKSALLQTIYGASGSTAATPRLFYCSESDTRRNIVTHVLVNLLLHRGCLESRYIDRRKRVASLTGLRRFVAQPLLLMRWADAQTSAAVSALFILVNSFAGLVGNISSTRALPTFVLPLALTAVLGGACGSYLGSRHLPHAAIQRALAVVLVIAGDKLIFRQ